MKSVRPWALGIQGILSLSGIIGYKLASNACDTNELTYLSTDCHSAIVIYFAVTFASM